MREEFIKTLETKQTAFDVTLDKDAVAMLADYFELISRHNEILHLVAPCSAEEFAVRHILESLTLLKYLPAQTKFCDVGTGAGLPSIPCLIVRKDLKANLIESKLKKGKFLEEALNVCGVSAQARIYNRQFEEIARPDVSFVTCRALDKFTQKIPRLLKWSQKANLLFFGGPALEDELKKNNLVFEKELMAFSNQRFLFNISK